MSVGLSVCRSVGRSRSVKKYSFPSPLVLRTFVIPYSWILRVICYSVFCPPPFLTYNRIAIICELLPVMCPNNNWARIWAVVDCTLYHVLFNSSPTRKLNFYHVWTLCMYKLSIIYVTWTQTLNQVGCMYNFLMILKILVYKVHSTIYRVLIISNICQ